MKPAVHHETKIARVAVNVRLYFDVPVTELDENAIRQSARTELARAEDVERIRITELRFPAVYPVDDWPALKSTDIDICDICPAREANKNTRFPL